MGNLFDLANFTRQKGQYTVREERIKREGSPPYIWVVPITGPGANSPIYPDTYFPLSRKYSPLDRIEIVNNDVVDIVVTVNQTEAFTCPAGTIRTITNLALRYVNVHNNHAATSSVLNAIIITLQKEPLTMDRWVRKYG